MTGQEFYTGPETDAEIMARINRVMTIIRGELVSATMKFGPFASAHEGLGVIYEEWIEFRDEVFASKAPGARARQRNEAVQLGAMAARFLLDVPPEGDQR